MVTAIWRLTTLVLGKRLRAHTASARPIILVRSNSMIENALRTPEAFAGMEMQRVTEALVAAKLSRNLERPRTETDGRFARAVRLADADGTYRQRLEARYEWIWTGFWWFDDIALLNRRCCR